jgi:hypothetical protein
MRSKQPCLAAGRAEQVVAKRVAEQGVAADGLRAWEVAVAALLASPKAAWNMRGIDSGTGPQLNAMPFGERRGSSRVMKLGLEQRGRSSKGGLNEFWKHVA